MKKKTAKKKPDNWIGSMKGSMKILGDIMSPVCEEGDWEAAQDEDTTKPPTLPDP